MAHYFNTQHPYFMEKKSALKTGCFIKAELIFYSGFFYAFLWRFSFPNLRPSFSEHLTDLYFISNYLPGRMLPPLDNWSPPYLFDSYYSLMHYAAALLGRIFSLSPGYSYEYAFCIIIGASVALGWYYISLFVTNKPTRVLLTALFLFGGTGIAPITHLLMDEDPNNNQSYHNLAERFMAEKSYGKTWTKLTASVRFAGLFENQINTELGKALFPKLTEIEIKEKTKQLTLSGFQGETFAKRQLPLEIFSYQLFLGDYHPPIASYLLLLLTLACMGYLEREPDNKKLQAIIAIIPSIVLISNAWIFPLQVLLTLTWAGYRIVSRKSLSWPHIFSGIFFGILLIYPFMKGFSAKTLDAQIKLVEMVNHTPENTFLWIFWPILFLCILAFIELFSRVSFKGSINNKQLIFTWLFTTLAILFLTEMVYVDDPTSGMFIRTNSTMKWWGWLWMLGTLTLATLLISSNKKMIRILTIS